MRNGNTWSEDGKQVGRAGGRDEREMCVLMCVEQERGPENLSVPPSHF